VKDLLRTAAQAGATHATPHPRDPRGAGGTAHAVDAPGPDAAVRPPAPAGDERPAWLPGQVPRDHTVAVVIPGYRAASTVVDVIARVPPLVWRIYVVDDGCPEGTGEAARAAADPRVRVLHNGRNLGVGGATKRGYAEALRDGADVVVKLDADGQMDPALIPLLVAPLLAGRADYAKGNRFAPQHRTPRGSAAGESRPMPPVRRLGNSMLSFLHKGVTGYWRIVDPTNGYTAIHREALQSIDLEAVANCYFFETDMLFQLNLADAVVRDVPLPSRYAGEVSSLRLRSVLVRFPLLGANRFFRRIGVKYFLQDFNVASLEMLLGLPLVAAGTAFGLYRWAEALRTGVANTPGTVMFAALPIILGAQLLLSALSYDVAHTPAAPLSRRGEEG
jgi:glycosyltransferase involved in cell wall biosynthesis